MRLPRPAAVALVLGLGLSPLAVPTAASAYWDGAPLGDARSWQIRTTTSALTGGSLDNATALQRAQAVGNVAPDGSLRTWKGVPASAAWQASKGGTAMLGATAFMASFEGTNMVLRAAGVDNVGLEALFPAEPDPNWYPHANGDVMVRTPGWVNGGPYDVPHVWKNNEVMNRAAVTIVQAPFYNEQQPSVVFEVSALSWGGPPDAWTETLGVNWRIFGINPQGGVQTIVNGGFADPKRGTSTFPVPQTATYSAPSLSRPLDRVELITAATSMGVPSGTVIDTWYPVGHPQRPEDTDPNPPRAWQTRWGCSSGAGGMRESAMFREADETFPEFPQAGPCEAGTIAHVEIWQVTPGGEGEDVKIIEWDPTGVVEWAGTFPQCTDGSCVLELFRLDPQTDSRLDCFADPSACVDWWEHPQRDDLFECRYGGTVVALAECSVYRPTINKLANAPVRDDEGNTRPAAEVGPHGDPGDEGNPVPLPEPPGTPSQPGNGCPPPFEFTAGGIGYWVTKGVGCALQAAFVPTRSDATIGRIRTAVNGTAPVVWSTAVGDMFDAVPTAGGCEGPPLRFNAFGMNVDSRPFSACSEPMTTAATWTRTITSVLVVIFGSMACVRALGSGLGWKPSAGGDS